MNKKLIKVRELAKILELSEKTAYEIIHSESFPKVNVGRKILIVESELDEWLASRIGTDLLDVK